MEFFKNDDDSCLFILLALKGNRKLGSGMVSSHMLGKLYSQSLIKKKHSMQSIKSITEEALKDVFWHEGYEIIMGEFNDQTAKITFNQKGLNFKVTDEENPSVNLISVGWRYTLDIKKVDTIYIYYKNEKVLSIKQK
jgi:hypothetical protein